MAEKAHPPITSSNPWTPEERTSQSQRLVEIFRKPAPCYGRALDDALAFVADAFRYKTRKGTDIPYLTHLLAVMALVGETKLATLDFFNISTQRSRAYRSSSRRPIESRHPLSITERYPHLIDPMTRFNTTTSLWAHVTFSP